MMMDMTSQANGLDFAPNAAAEEPSEGGGMNRLRLAQWMIVLSLSMLFVPIMLLGQTITEQGTVIQERLVELQAQIDSPDVDPVAETLQDTLTSARTERAELQAVVNYLDSENMAWGVVIQTLGNYDAQHIELIDVRHTLSDSVEVQGYARAESSVIVYERQLETAGVFGEVDILSITFEPETGDVATRFPIHFHMKLTPERESDELR
jgi:Tfp pilus assembly protein PilN